MPDSETQLPLPITTEEKYPSWVVVIGYTGDSNGSWKHGFLNITINGPGIESLEDWQGLHNLVSKLALEELKLKDLSVAVVNLIKLPIK